MLERKPPKFVDLQKCDACRARGQALPQIVKPGRPNSVSDEEM